MRDVYKRQHAAGAVPSGFDSIHLEMAEFSSAFDAGRTGMDLSLIHS